MREDKLVRWFIRRTPWICLALATLAINFLAIAAWRYKVYMYGPQEAFLRHEPSPLLADYEELVAREKLLDARWQANDPDVDYRDLYALRCAQQDMYPAVVQDHNARWTAAQTVEFQVFWTFSLIGTCLGTIAGVWYLLYLAHKNEARRGCANPARSPGG
jgi:hypothetical protein